MDTDNIREYRDIARTIGCRAGARRAGEGQRDASVRVLRRPSFLGVGPGPELDRDAGGDVRVSGVPALRQVLELEDARVPGEPGAVS